MVLEDFHSKANQLVTNIHNKEITLPKNGYGCNSLITNIVTQLYKNHQQLRIEFSK